MEEIKIKCYDKNHKGLSWHSTSIVWKTGKPEKPLYKSTKNYWTVLWTGKKCKKGSFLYEGDVIEWPTYNTVKGKKYIKKVSRRVIRWDHARAGFVPFIDMMKPKEREITYLGNIFDHPELRQFLKDNSHTEKEMSNIEKKIVGTYSSNS